MDNDVKVLWVGVTHDSTGYAQASIDYILALDSVGIDVTCRPISMTRSKFPVPKRIEELEKKSIKDINIIIQHNLPNTFGRKEGIQNIGAFAYETDNLFNSGWDEHLLLMDKIIVFCEHQRAVLRKTLGNDSNVYVVPHTTDVEKYKKKYTKIDFGISGRPILFYTISDFRKRKNLQTMIIGYLQAFDSDNNVVLVIKLPDEGQVTSIQENINIIKKSMKRFNRFGVFPKILLIGNRFSDEQICQLHASCDIFVNTSHAESWSIPTMDALGFGHPVIVPDHTAFQDYPRYGFQKYIDLRVFETPRTMVVGTDNRDVPFLYTSDETWYQINPLSVKHQFQFTQKHVRDGSLKTYSEKRTELVEKAFSYKVIGEKLSEVFTNVK